jgi:hypothetical protein
MGKTIFTNVYVGKKSLKIFSRTSRPISIKLDTMKGIQVYTNKGPGHLQREVNAKMEWGHLIFFLKNHTATKVDS